MSGIDPFAIETAPMLQRSCAKEIVKMLKFMVVLLAVVAVCWGVYIYFPQTTQVAVSGNIPHTQSHYAITWMMGIGAVVTYAFYRIVKGK